MKIAKVLGTDELYAYIDKYNITLEQQYNDMIGQHSRKPWSKFVTSQNEHLVSEEALDLLSKMLRYDHAERITPKDAMEHTYFKPVKEFHAKGGLSAAATGKWINEKCNGCIFLNI